MVKHSDSIAKGGDYVSQNHPHEEELTSIRSSSQQIPTAGIRYMSFQASEKQRNCLRIDPFHCQAWVLPYLRQPSSGASSSNETSSGEESSSLSKARTHTSSVVLKKRKKSSKHQRIRFARPVFGKPRKIYNPEIFVPQYYGTTAKQTPSSSSSLHHAPQLASSSSVKDGLIRASSPTSSGVLGGRKASSSEHHRFQALNRVLGDGDVRAPHLIRLSSAVGKRSTHTHAIPQQTAASARKDKPAMSPPSSGWEVAEDLRESSLLVPEANGVMPSQDFIATTHKGGKEKRFMSIQNPLVPSAALNSLEGSFSEDAPVGVEAHLPSHLSSSSSSSSSLPADSLTKPDLPESSCTVWNAHQQEATSLTHNPLPLLDSRRTEVESSASLSEEASSSPAYSLQRPSSIIPPLDNSALPPKKEDEAGTTHIPSIRSTQNWSHTHGLGASIDDTKPGSGNGARRSRRKLGGGDSLGRMSMGDHSISSSGIHREASSCSLEEGMVRAANEAFFEDTHTTQSRVDAIENQEDGISTDASYKQEKKKKKRKKDEVPGSGSSSSDLVSAATSKGRGFPSQLSNVEIVFQEAFRAEMKAFYGSLEGYETDFISFSDESLLEKLYLEDVMKKRKRIGMNSEAQKTAFPSTLLSPFPASKDRLPDTPSVFSRGGKIPGIPPHPHDLPFVAIPPDWDDALPPSVYAHPPQRGSLSSKYAASKSVVVADGGRRKRSSSVFFEEGRVCSTKKLLQKPEGREDSWHPSTHKTNISISLAESLRQSLQLQLEAVEAWIIQANSMLIDRGVDDKADILEAQFHLEEGRMLAKFIELPQLKEFEEHMKRALSYSARIKKRFLVKEGDKSSEASPSYRTLSGVGAEKGASSDNPKDSPPNTGRVKISVLELSSLLKEGITKIEFLVPEFRFLQHQLLQMGTWHSIVQTAIDEANLLKCEEIIKEGDLLYVELPGFKFLSKQVAISAWIEKVEKMILKPLRIGLAEQVLSEDIVLWIESDKVPCKKRLEQRVEKAHRWTEKALRPPFVSYLKISVDAQTFAEYKKNSLPAIRPKLGYRKDSAVAAAGGGDPVQQRIPTAEEDNLASRMNEAHESFEGGQKPPQASLDTAHSGETLAAKELDRVSSNLAFSICTRKRGHAQRVSAANTQEANEDLAVNDESSGLLSDTVAAEDASSGLAREDDEDDTGKRFATPAELDELCSEYQSFRLHVQFFKNFESLNQRWKRWHKRYKKAIDGSMPLQDCLIILQEAESLSEVLDISAWHSVLKMRVDETLGFVSVAREFLSRVYSTTVDNSLAKTSFHMSSLESLKRKSVITPADYEAVLSMTPSSNRGTVSELLELLHSHEKLLIKNWPLQKELSDTLEKVERWRKRAKDVLSGPRGCPSMYRLVALLLVECMYICIEMDVEKKLRSELYYMQWHERIIGLSFPVDEAEVEELFALPSRLEFLKLMDRTTPVENYMHGMKRRHNDGWKGKGGASSKGGLPVEASKESLAGDTTTGRSNMLRKEGPHTQTHNPPQELKIFLSSQRPSRHRRSKGVKGGWVGGDMKTSAALQEEPSAPLSSSTDGGWVGKVGGDVSSSDGGLPINCISASGGAVRTPQEKASLAAKEVVGGEEGGFPLEELPSGESIPSPSGASQGGENQNNEISPPHILPIHKGVGTAASSIPPSLHSEDSLEGECASSQPCEATNNPPPLPKDDLQDDHSSAQKTTPLQQKGTQLTPAIFPSPASPEMSLNPPTNPPPSFPTLLDSENMKEVAAAHEDASQMKQIERSPPPPPFESEDQPKDTSHLQLDSIEPFLPPPSSDTFTPPEGVETLGGVSNEVVEGEGESGGKIEMCARTSGPNEDEEEVEDEDEMETKPKPPSVTADDGENSAEGDAMLGLVESHPPPGFLCDEDSQLKEDAATLVSPTSSSAHDGAGGSLDNEEVAEVSLWHRLIRLPEFEFIERLHQLSIEWAEAYKHMTTCTPKKKKDVWQQMLQDVTDLPVRLIGISSAISAFLRDLNHLEETLLSFGEKPNLQQLTSIKSFIEACPIEVTAWSEVSPRFDELTAIEKLGKQLVDSTNTTIEELREFFQTLERNSEDLESLPMSSKAHKHLADSLSWIEEGERLSRSAGSLEQWSSLITRGEKLKVYVPRVSEIRGKVLESREWLEIYYHLSGMKPPSTSSRRTASSKQHTVAGTTRLSLTDAEKLVFIPYGLGEQLIDFANLSDMVKSCQKLKLRCEEVLRISFHQRGNLMFFHAVEEEGLAAKLAETSEELQSLLVQCRSSPLSVALEAVLKQEVEFRQYNKTLLALLQTYHPSLREAIAVIATIEANGLHRPPGWRTPSESSSVLSASSSDEYIAPSEANAAAPLGEAYDVKCLSATKNSSEESSSSFGTSSRKLRKLIDGTHSFVALHSPRQQVEASGEEEAPTVRSWLRRPFPAVPATPTHTGSECVQPTFPPGEACGSGEPHGEPPSSFSEEVVRSVKRAKREQSSASEADHMIQQGLSEDAANFSALSVDYSVGVLASGSEGGGGYRAPDAPASSIEDGSCVPAPHQGGSLADSQSLGEASVEGGESEGLQDAPGSSADLGRNGGADWIPLKNEVSKLYVSHTHGEVESSQLQYTVGGNETLQSDVCLYKFGGDGLGGREDLRSFPSFSTSNGCGVSQHPPLASDESPASPGVFKQANSLELAAIKLEPLPEASNIEQKDAYHISNQHEAFDEQLPSSFSSMKSSLTHAPDDTGRNVWWGASYPPPTPNSYEENDVSVYSSDSRGCTYTDVPSAKSEETTPPEFLPSLEGAPPTGEGKDAAASFSDASVCVKDTSYEAASFAVPPSSLVVLCDVPTPSIEQPVGQKRGMIASDRRGDSQRQVAPEQSEATVFAASAAGIPSTNTRLESQEEKEEVHGALPASSCVQFAPLHEKEAAFGRNLPSTKGVLPNSEVPNKPFGEGLELPLPVDSLESLRGFSVSPSDAATGSFPELPSGSGSSLSLNVEHTQTNLSQPAVETSSVCCVNQSPEGGVTSCDSTDPSVKVSVVKDDGRKLGFSLAGASTGSQLSTSGEGKELEALVSAEEGTPSVCLGISESPRTNEEITTVWEDNPTASLTASRVCSSQADGSLSAASKPEVEAFSPPFVDSSSKAHDISVIGGNPPMLLTMECLPSESSGSSAWQLTPQEKLQGGSVLTHLLGVSVSPSSQPGLPSVESLLTPAPHSSPPSCPTPHQDLPTDASVMQATLPTHPVSQPISQPPTHRSPSKTNPPPKTRPSKSTPSHTPHQPSPLSEKQSNPTNFAMPSWLCERSKGSSSDSAAALEIRANMWKTMELAASLNKAKELQIPENLQQIDTLIFESIKRRINSTFDWIAHFDSLLLLTPLSDSEGSADREAFSEELKKVSDELKPLKSIQQTMKYLPAEVQNYLMYNLVKRGEELPIIINYKALFEHYKLLLFHSEEGKPPINSPSSALLAGKGFLCKTDELLAVSNPLQPPLPPLMGGSASSYSPNHPSPLEVSMLVPSDMKIGYDPGYSYHCSTAYAMHYRQLTKTPWPYSDIRTYHPSLLQERRLLLAKAAVGVEGGESGVVTPSLVNQKGSGGKKGSVVTATTSSGSRREREVAFTANNQGLAPEVNPPPSHPLSTRSRSSSFAGGGRVPQTSNAMLHSAVQAQRSSGSSASKALTSGGKSNASTYGGGGFATSQKHHSLGGYNTLQHNPPPPEAYSSPSTRQGHQRALSGSSTSLPPFGGGLPSLKKSHEHEGFQANVVNLMGEHANTTPLDGHPGSHSGLTLSDASKASFIEQTAFDTPSLMTRQASVGGGSASFHIKTTSHQRSTASLKNIPKSASSVSAASKPAGKKKGGIAASAAVMVDAHHKAPSNKKKKHSSTSSVNNCPPSSAGFASSSDSSLEVGGGVVSSWNHSHSSLPSQGAGHPPHLDAPKNLKASVNVKKYHKAGASAKGGVQHGAVSTQNPTSSSSSAYPVGVSAGGGSGGRGVVRGGSHYATSQASRSDSAAAGGVGGGGSVGGGKGGRNSSSVDFASGGRDAGNFGQSTSQQLKGGGFVERLSTQRHHRKSGSHYAPPYSRGGGGGAGRDSFLQFPHRNAGPREEGPVKIRSFTCRELLKAASKELPNMATALLMLYQAESEKLFYTPEIDILRAFVETVLVLQHIVYQNFPFLKPRVLGKSCEYHTLPLRRRSASFWSVGSSKPFSAGVYDLGVSPSPSSSEGKLTPADEILNEELINRMRKNRLRYYQKMKKIQEVHYLRYPDSPKFLDKASLIARYKLAIPVDEDSVCSGLPTGVRTSIDDDSSDSEPEEMAACYDPLLYGSLCASNPNRSVFSLLEDRRKASRTLVDSTHAHNPTDKEGERTHSSDEDLPSEFNVIEDFWCECKWECGLEQWETVEDFIVSGSGLTSHTVMAPVQLKPEAVDADPPPPLSSNEVTENARTLRSSKRVHDKKLSSSKAPPRGRLQDQEEDRSLFRSKPPTISFRGDHLQNPLKDLKEGESSSFAQGLNRVLHGNCEASKCVEDIFKVYEAVNNEDLDFLAQNSTMGVVSIGIPDQTKNAPQTWQVELPLRSLSNFEKTPDEIESGKVDLLKLLRLVELFDVMPLQVPLKGRLVHKLLVALDWALQAREAINLCPKDSMARQWVTSLQDKTITVDSRPYVSEKLLCRLLSPPKLSAYRAAEERLEQDSAAEEQEDEVVSLDGPQQGEHEDENKGGSKKHTRHTASLSKKMSVCDLIGVDTPTVPASLNAKGNLTISTVASPQLKPIQQSFIYINDLQGVLANTQPDLCPICAVLPRVDDVAYWIACDECNRWYHTKCVGFTGSLNSETSVNYWRCLCCSVRSKWFNNEEGEGAGGGRPVGGSKEAEDEFSLLSRTATLYISSFPSSKRRLPSMRRVQRLLKMANDEDLSHLFLPERDILLHRLAYSILWIEDMKAMWGSLLSLPPEAKKVSKEEFADTGEAFKIPTTLPPTIPPTISPTNPSTLPFNYDDTTSKRDIHPLKNSQLPPLSEGVSAGISLLQEGGSSVHTPSEAINTDQCATISVADEINTRVLPPIPSSKLPPIPMTDVNDSLEGSFEDNSKSKAASDDSTPGEGKLLQVALSSNVASDGSSKRREDASVSVYSSLEVEAGNYAVSTSHTQPVHAVGYSSNAVSGADSSLKILESTQRASEASDDVWSKAANLREAEDHAAMLSSAFALYTTHEDQRASLNSENAPSRAASSEITHGYPPHDDYSTLDTTSPTLIWRQILKRMRCGGGGRVYAWRQSPNEANEVDFLRPKGEVWRPPPMSDAQNLPSKTDPYHPAPHVTHTGLSDIPFASVLRGVNSSNPHTDSQLMDLQYTSSDAAASAASSAVAAVSVASFSSFTSSSSSPSSSTPAKTSQEIAPHGDSLPPQLQTNTPLSPSYTTIILPYNLGTLQLPITKPMVHTHPPHPDSPASARKIKVEDLRWLLACGMMIGIRNIFEVGLLAMKLSEQREIDGLLNATLKWLEQYFAEKEAAKKKKQLLQQQQTNGGSLLPSEGRSSGLHQEGVGSDLQSAGKQEGETVASLLTGYNKQVRLPLRLLWYLATPSADLGVENQLHIADFDLLSSEGKKCVQIINQAMLIKKKIDSLYLDEGLWVDGMGVDGNSSGEGVVGVVDEVGGGVGAQGGTQGGAEGDAQGVIAGDGGAHATIQATTLPAAHTTSLVPSSSRATDGTVVPSTSSSSSTTETPLPALLRPSRRSFFARCVRIISSSCLASLNPSVKLELQKVLSLVQSIHGGAFFYDGTEMLQEIFTLLEFIEDTEKFAAIVSSFPEMKRENGLSSDIISYLFKTFPAVISLGQFAAFDNRFVNLLTPAAYALKYLKDRFFEAPVNASCVCGSDSSLTHSELSNAGSSGAGVSVFTLAAGVAGDSSFAGATSRTTTAHNAADSSIEHYDVHMSTKTEINTQPSPESSLTHTPALVKPPLATPNTSLVSTSTDQNPYSSSNPPSSPTPSGSQSFLRYAKDPANRPLKPPLLAPGDYSSNPRLSPNQHPPLPLVLHQAESFPAISTTGTHLPSAKAEGFPLIILKLYVLLYEKAKHLMCFFNDLFDDVVAFERDVRLLSIVSLQQEVLDGMKNPLIPTHRYDLLEMVKEKERINGFLVECVPSVDEREISWLTRRSLPKSEAFQATMSEELSEEGAGELRESRNLEEAASEECGGKSNAFASCSSSSFLSNLLASSSSSTSSLSVLPPLSSSLSPLPPPPTPPFNPPELTKASLQPSSSQLHTSPEGSRKGNLHASTPPEFTSSHPHPPHSPHTYVEAKQMTATSETPLTPPIPTHKTQTIHASSTEDRENLQSWHLPTATSVLPLNAPSSRPKAAHPFIPEAPPSNSNTHTTVPSGSSLSNISTDETRITPGSPSAHTQQPTLPLGVSSSSDPPLVQHDPDASKPSQAPPTPTSPHLPEATQTPSLPPATPLPRKIRLLASVPGGLTTVQSSPAKKMETSPNSDALAHSSPQAVGGVVKTQAAALGEGGGLVRQVSPLPPTASTSPQEVGRPAYAEGNSITTKITVDQMLHIIYNVLKLRVSTFCRESLLFLYQRMRTIQSEVAQMIEKKVQLENKDQLQNAILELQRFPIKMVELEHLQQFRGLVMQWVKRIKVATSEDRQMNLSELQQLYEDSLHLPVNVSKSKIMIELRKQIKILSSSGVETGHSIKQ